MCFITWKVMACCRGYVYNKIMKIGVRGVFDLEGPSVILRDTFSSKLSHVKRVFSFSEQTFK